MNNLISLVKKCVNLVKIPRGKSIKIEGAKRSSPDIIYGSIFNRYGKYFGPGEAIKKMHFLEIPIYHFLIPLISILNIWAANLRILSLTDVIGPILTCISFTFILFITGRVVFRGWSKSAAILGVTYVHLFFNEIFPGGMIQNIFIATVGLFSILLVFQPAASFRRFTPAANIMFLTMVLIPLFRIVPYNLTTISVVPQNTSSSYHISQRKNLPDIYFIILDGYARADILKNYYNFDNSAFLTQLRDKGFFVVENSRANYGQTFLSLASMTNLSYLQDAFDMDTDENDLFRGVIKSISNGPLWSLLKEAGYRIVVVPTGISHIKIDNRDVTYLRGGLTLSNLSQKLILSLSIYKIAPKLLKLLRHILKSDFISQLHRNKIVNGIRALPSLRIENQPSFVFAHLNIPHPPFLFRMDGTPTPKDEFVFSFNDGGAWRLENKASGEEYRKAYLGQLRYLNSLVLDAISQILDNQKRPAAILIVSDHGPGSMLDQSSIDNTNPALAERLFNLQAHYWPKGNYHALHNNLTLVNSLRVMLNQQLGTAFEPLPDRSYYSTVKKPFKLIEWKDY